MSISSGLHMPIEPSHPSAKWGAFEWGAVILGAAIAERADGSLVIVYSEVGASSPSTR